jgi:hypothetical protein
MVVHKAEHCYKLEAIRDKHFEGWKSALPTPARQAPGTNRVDLDKYTAKLVKTPALLNNYWSPLACLADAQEKKSAQQNKSSTGIEKAWFAQTECSLINKLAAHWAQKIVNR